MLQKLLNLGLVEIGSDDSRFEKIEAAGAALMKHLRGDPALIIPATLIAIDYDADEAEPVFNLVEEHVIQQWNTMRNTHVNRPRELLRSTIIHVLSLLAEENSEMAALIWHTVVSPLNQRSGEAGQRGGTRQGISARTRKAGRGRCGRLCTAARTNVKERYGEEERRQEERSGPQILHAPKTGLGCA